MQPRKTNTPSIMGIHRAYLTRTDSKTFELSGFPMPSYLRRAFDSPIAKLLADAPIGAEQPHPALDRNAFPKGEQ